MRPPSIVLAEGTLLVMLVVLPAALNPAGVLAIEPLKASVLRVGAVIMAVSWLSYRFSGHSTVNIGAHPIVRAGLVVLGLAGVSTLLSLEPALSFFGSFDRGMGWLSLAADVVLLMVVADLLADDRRRERAITALLLGSVIPCAYLLLQRVGIDPINWATTGQPGSTFGSPTFLGGFLVMVAPFAAYRVVLLARTELRGQGATFGYAAALALLLIVSAVVLLTTIRGVLLGLVAAMLAFAVLASGRRRIGRTEIALAVAALVIAVGLAVAAAGASGLLSIQRFASIGGAIDSSSERLTVWKDSVRAPLGDPVRILFGYGDDTQSVVFEHFEATIRQTPAELWDRAHDLLLDTWLTGGLLGVFGLLALLGLALRSAWQARAGGNLLASAILAALIGHIVEVSFAFHSVVTGAVFWVVLGLAASLTPRCAPVQLKRPRAVGLIGVVAGVLLIPIVATPAVADWMYGAARRSPYDVGARLEEQAATMAPWVEELPRAAGLDWLQVLANRRNDLAAAARAEADLLEAANRAPLAPLPEVRLTRLYATRHQYDQAEAACQRALTLGPYRAAVWDACAEVSTGRGLADEAAARQARANELRPPV